MAVCTRCPELCASRTQIVPPTPALAGGILCIGEAPGEREDAHAEGFMGAAGKTLDRLMLAIGLSRQGYGRGNICRCRPPENRKPTPQEVANCLPLLAEFILSSQPAVLFLVGGTAAQAFLGKASLSELIAESRERQGLPFEQGRAHPGLAALSGTDIRLVPSPHTSGLSWNRKSPDGIPWSTIGMDQAELARSLVPTLAGTGFSLCHSN